MSRTPLEATSFRGGNGHGRLAEFQLQSRQAFARAQGRPARLRITSRSRIFRRQNKRGFSMRFLLATTGLGAIAAATVAVPAHAETQISTAVTTPQTTSASGDLHIMTAGSVKPASGVAVTMNSNNYVINNSTIQITGADNSAGIVANAGLTGAITNTGTITIDETFTPTDTDNDGDLDGPFAQGSNRFGIHVLGAHTGAITNSGKILVEGNNSGGIVLEGPLTGTLSNSADITVLGNNTVGIKAGAVSGDVLLSRGTIQVQGAGAVGVNLTGDIGGKLVLQGSVQTTGYRYTTAPADVSKLDADDLLQGGSAVIIGGNVAGGILFDAKPADSDPNNADEDADGTPDANETTSSIIALGSAPAVIVGSSTQATNIGAVAGSGGQGLVQKGTILAAGVYKNVSSSALVIGGLGNAVNVAGGMTNNGSITATASEANATAVRIGAGASVLLIINSGTISATGGGAATNTAQGIAIDAGATVTTIKNSGEIGATLAGADGVATAIIDNSGGLSLIENTGSITVANASTLGAKAVAFDLRANGTGATVRQLAVTTGTAPSINGQMLFGSGSDTLDIADGAVNGTAKFGLGNNTLSLSGDAVMRGGAQFGTGADTVQLAGTSQLFGDIDFGGGADVLTLGGTSSYKGQLAGTAGLAVTLGAGTGLYREQSRNRRPRLPHHGEQFNARRYDELGDRYEHLVQCHWRRELRHRHEHRRKSRFAGRCYGHVQGLPGRHPHWCGQPDEFGRIAAVHLRQQRCHEHAERGVCHHPAEDRRGTRDRLSEAGILDALLEVADESGHRPGLPWHPGQREPAKCIAAGPSRSRGRRFRDSDEGHPSSWPHPVGPSRSAGSPRNARLLGTAGRLAKTRRSAPHPPITSVAGARPRASRGRLDRSATSARRFRISAARTAGRIATTSFRARSSRAALISAVALVRSVPLPAGPSAGRASTQFASSPETSAELRLRARPRANGTARCIPARRAFRTTRASVPSPPTDRLNRALFVERKGLHREGRR